MIEFSFLKRFSPNAKESGKLFPGLNPSGNWKEAFGGGLADLRFSLCKYTASGFAGKFLYLASGWN